MPGPGQSGAGARGSRPVQETAQAILDAAEDAAEKVDSIGPEVLQIGGAVLGLPVLAAAGALWSRWRAGRRFGNLVEAVQAGRAQLSGIEGGAPLARFDMVLAEKSPEATQAAVRAVKKKRKIKSVTTPEPLSTKT